MVHATVARQFKEGGLQIENEPKNFKEVIRLEGIRTNMDISSEIIKKQMTEYGPKLDRLLSKVLWSSLFS